MKSKYRILIFLLACLHGLQAQERVSDIQNTGPLAQLNMAMILTEDAEYIAATTLYETTLYKVSHQNLTLQSSWTHRPVEQLPTRFVDPQNENSLVLYKNRYLLEVYMNSLVFTDIFTGTLWKHIELPYESFRFYYTNVYILDDGLLYFQCYYQGEHVFLSVNVENDTWKVLPFGVSFHDRIYFYRNKELWTYNVKSNQETLVHSFDEEINTVLKIGNLLWIPTSGGRNFLLDQDANVEELTCRFPDNLYDVFVKDSLMFFQYYDENQQKIRVVDPTFCDSVIWEGENMSFMLGTRETPPGHLLIQQEENSWLKLMIFDIRTASLTAISNQHNDYAYHGLFSLTDQSIGYYNFISLARNTFFVTRIDYLSKEIAEIALPGAQSTDYFVFGKGDHDGQNVFQIDNHQKIRWWRIGHDDDQGVLMDSVMLNSGNRGLRMLALPEEADDQIYFPDTKGLYVIKGNETKLQYAGTQVAGPVRNGDYLYHTVFHFPLGHGFIKTNPETLVSTFTRFPANQQDISEMARVGNGFLVKLKNSSRFFSWFDVRTETFKEFIIEGEKEGALTYKVSGDLVLLHFFIKNKIKYFLLNTLTEEWMALEYLNQVVSISSGFDNDFYVLMTEGGRKLIQIHQDGSFSVIQNMPAGTPQYMVRNVHGDNNMTVIELSDFTNRLFIMVMDGDMKSYLFEKLGTVRIWLFPPYIWLESRSSVGLYSRWFWRFGKEPEPFLFRQDEAMSQVFLEKEECILFFGNTRNRELTKINYDIQTKELSGQHSYPMTFANNYFNAHPLGDGAYFMAYNDGARGQEPWIYDHKQDRLFMLKDMFQGQHGSNPSGFLAAGDFFYFTAMDNTLARQWYRIHKRDYTKVERISPPDIVRVFPNPGDGFWQCTVPVHDVGVFDNNGRLLLTKNDWQTGELWDVSSLPAGQFTLIAKDKNGNAVSQILMKI